MVIKKNNQASAGRAIRCNTFCKICPEQTKDFLQKYFRFYPSRLAYKILSLY
jgi:hypothetical protein